VSWLRGSHAVAISFLVLCCTSIVRSQVAPHVDSVVVRELQPLLPHVFGYGASRKRDVEAFVRAVLPFGPLDIEVRNPQYFRSASIARVQYLQALAEAFDLDALGIASSFLCGFPCVQSRKAQAVDRLDSLTLVVNYLRANESVQILANWGIIGEFRVNDVFRMMGQTFEARESQLAGLVPSGSWSAPIEMDSYLRKLRLVQAEFDNVIQLLKRLSFAAVVRCGTNCIRAIRTGIGASESGLLFLSTEARPPAIGDMWWAGKQFTQIEEIAPTVFYFETGWPDIR
jgi:hypothetical protein